VEESNRSVSSENSGRLRSTGPENEEKKPGLYRIYGEMKNRDLCKKEVGKPDPK